MELVLAAVVWAISMVFTEVVQLLAGRRRRRCPAAPIGTAGYRCPCKYSSWALLLGLDLFIPEVLYEMLSDIESGLANIDWSVQPELALYIMDCNKPAVEDNVVIDRPDRRSHGAANPGDRHKVKTYALS